MHILLNFNPFSINGKTYQKRNKNALAVWSILLKISCPALLLWQPLIAPFGELIVIGLVDASLDLPMTNEHFTLPLTSVILRYVTAHNPAVMRQRSGAVGLRLPLPNKVSWSSGQLWVAQALVTLGARFAGSAWTDLEFGHSSQTYFGTCLEGWVSR